MEINTKNHNILTFTMQKVISVYSSNLCLWYHQDIERYNGRYFTLMNSVCYSKANTYTKKTENLFCPLQLRDRNIPLHSKKEIQCQ